MLRLVTPQTRTKIHCTLHGHSPDPFEGRCCVECGGNIKEEDSCSGILGAIHFHVNVNPPRWLKALRGIPTMFKQCPDCGKRFHKHTPECPPF